MESAFLTLIPIESKKKKPLIIVKNSPTKPPATSLSVSIKFTYMNKRPRSTYATPPSTKVTFTPSSTGINLGPGKYRTFSLDSTPSFEFSKCERFGNESNASALFLFRKASDEDKEKILNRIQKNKEQAVISRHERAKSVMVNASREKFRGEVTRMTKKAIYYDRKAKKQSKIEEKFLKYEYRMKIQV